MTRPRLNAVLRRYARDDRGVAMVEFALVLPVLLILVCGALEVAHFAIATMRVNQITMTLSDNAARVRSSINESDVNELLLGATLIGRAFEFAEKGRVVVSSVQSNGFADGRKGFTINWQRCTGALNVTESQPAYGREGKGRTDNSLQYMGKSTNPIAPAGGATMIFVEATYEYQPLFSNAFLGRRLIRSESAFDVRERESNTLDPDDMPKNLCTAYSSTVST
jgi:Flp pilus assembly protein TadG